jgi:hypothetical protein
MYNTRALQIVTSGGLLTTQAMKNKLLYTKKYICKLSRVLCHIFIIWFQFCFSL